MKKIYILSLLFTSLYSEIKIEIDSELPKTIYWIDINQSGKYPFTEYLNEAIESATKKLKDLNIYLDVNFTIAIREFSELTLAFTQDNIIYLNSTLTSKSLIQKSVVHEMMHIYQLNYFKMSLDDLNESDRWFFEGLAVWFEKLIYPNEFNSDIYKNSLIKNSNLGIFYSESFNIYSSYLFIEFLINRGYNTIFELFERFKQNIDSFIVVDNFNRRLQEFYDEFLLKNKIDSKDVTTIYFGGILQFESNKLIFSKDFKNIDLNQNSSTIHQLERNNTYISFTKELIEIQLDDIKNNITLNGVDSWQMVGIPFDIDSIDDRCDYYIYRDNSWIKNRDIRAGEGFWIKCNESTVNILNKYKLVTQNSVKNASKFHFLSNPLSLDLYFNNFNRKNYIFKDNQWYFDLSFITSHSGIWIKF